MRFVKFMFVVLVVLSIRQAGAWAFNGCPSGAEDEVFCEDFDTYCARTDGLGYPGDPDCAPGAAKNNALMQEVWPNGGCGSTFNIRDNDYVTIGVDPGFADQSPIFGVGYMFTSRPPIPDGGLLGQQSFRDWADPAHPNNLSRLIGNVFNKPGYTYDAVAGTDDKPLIMEFFMNGLNSGKLYWGNGYWELALGDDRANTDYVHSPNCATYCNPPITQGPFPIICAQGNPDGPLPTGCPSAGTAPIHKSIAVGVLTLVDTDPCHCGVQAHGPHGSHLMVYDGQRWWALKQNLVPGGTSGSVVGKKATSPNPPPYDDVVPGSGIPRPGDFVLGMGLNQSLNRAHNWVKLTIKSTTIDIEHTAFFRANSSYNGSPIDYPSYGFPPYDAGDYQWWITNVITGIPRAYKHDPANNLTGAFDTIRMGVGPGCPLASNADWTTCDPAAPERTCISANSENSAGLVVTNDFSLHGGAGYSQFGACCLPDGTCTDPISSSDCTNQGGYFRGPSTVCGDGSICIGACCKGEAAGCSDSRRVDCPAPFVFKGEGTQCATTDCPCSTPFADADLDGDVDQMDFAVLQDCYTGSGSYALDAVCKCFDVTNSTGGGPDNAVDNSDVARFEACASGPGIAVSSACN